MSEQSTVSVELPEETRTSWWLPWARKALTALMSCTRVTMLLAKSRRSAMMLRPRTMLRPMKMSTQEVHRSRNLR